MLSIRRYFCTSQGLVITSLMGIHEAVWSLALSTNFNDGYSHKGIGLTKSSGHEGSKGTTGDYVEKGVGKEGAVTGVHVVHSSRKVIVPETYQCRASEGQRIGSQIMCADNEQLGWPMQ